MVGVKKSKSSGITYNSRTVLRSMTSNINNAKRGTKVLSEINKTKSKIKSTVKCNQSNAGKVLNIKRNPHGDSLKAKNQTKITSFIYSLGKENLRSKVLKNDKKESSEIKAVTKKSHLPVWKTALDMNKSKVDENFDVYDISHDEAMSLEPKFKKPKIKKSKHCVKRMPNKKVKKKSQAKDQCVVHADSANFHMSPSVDNSQDIPLSTNNPYVNVEPESQKVDNIPTCTHHNETSEQSYPSVLDITISQPGKTAISNDVSILDTETFMSQLADEIERSFLIPPMTSTPAPVRRMRDKILPQILNGSHIQIPLNDQTESCSSVVRNNIDKNVTLFESPTKAKRGNQKNTLIKFMSRKNCQQNCFSEEISPTLEDPEDIETSVLEPHKAYHTPDHFKTHMHRIKRASVAEKKPSKTKSKEEQLVETMAKHFEEIEETELFIE